MRVLYLRLWENQGKEPPRLLPVVRIKLINLTVLHRFAPFYHVPL